MSLPSWLRNPRTADITLTLVVGLIVLPGVIADADEEGRSLAVAALVGAATVLPVLVRRRAPFACLGLIAVFMLVPPDDGAYVLPLMVALYTIGPTRSWETTAAAAASVVLVGVVYRLAGGAEFADGDVVRARLRVRARQLRRPLRDRPHHPWLTRSRSPTAVTIHTSLPIGTIA